MEISVNVNEKALELFKGQTHGYSPKVTGIQKDGNKVILRLFKYGENEVCFYRKGSHKRGYYLTDFSSSNPLVNIIPIVHRKTTAEKWLTGWKKTLARLETSGLWENVQEEISVALDIGYDKIKIAYDKYWEINDEKEKIAFLKTIDTRLIGVNDKGEEYTKSSQIWNYAKLPLVKKMYFGKYRNAETLERIRKAMESKKPISESGRASYDVSFEYKPEANKAWYSLEYLGCGNGHYYLALNATHAIWIEND